LQAGSGRGGDRKALASEKMSQATRLDRLILLLDTGSASATRKAAAEQIGELSEGGSDAQIQGLLARVRAKLRSKTWESRVAAAQAIESIVRRIPVWYPETAAPEVKEEDEAGAEERLKLASFDIGGVLERGCVLVSSAGSEYDDVVMDPKERLALQKQQLRSTLGLDPHVAKKAAAAGGGAGSAGNVKGDIFNVQDMVQDEDLIVSAPKEEPGAQKRKAAEATGNIQDALEGLSARERNQLRRKQRKLAKQPPAPVAPAAAPGPGRAHVTDQPQDAGKVVVEFSSNSEAALAAMDPAEWRLGWLCEELSHDLFDPAWEVPARPCPPLPRRPAAARRRGGAARGAAPALVEGAGRRRAGAARCSDGSPRGAQAPRAGRGAVGGDHCGAPGGGQRGVAGGVRREAALRPRARPLRGLRRRPGALP
jgi:TATA-binding protein-associated factor